MNNGQETLLLASSVFFLLLIAAPLTVLLYMYMGLIGVGVFIILFALCSLLVYGAARFAVQKSTSE